MAGSARAPPFSFVALSYVRRGLRPTGQPGWGVYSCPMPLELVEYSLWAGNLPVNTPSEWTPAVPSTGTVDDLDEPEDEREDENEIPVAAPTDDTEAPEEFEENEEVGDPIDPPEPPP